MKLGRLLTAMVTPFNKDGAVNYALAEKLAVKLVEDGSDGLVIHGTTGESPTLTHEEEYKLYRAVKKAVGGKATVIAGTGSNSTATSIDSTKQAEKIGVDGIMIVVPYYNKPSQEGQYRHFKAVADSTDLPIIIYNIPGRTGVNMLPETVARLSKIKNIVGIKEATGDLGQVSLIKTMVPDNFLIWSGDDNLTLPIMAAGGCGVISVAAHLVGKEMKEMIEAFVAGDNAKALKLHLRLMPLFKAIFVTVNPTPIKAALRMTGWEVGMPRLPLVDVTEKEGEHLRKVLSDLKLV